ncbi:malonate decarboxylase acyl carrier protein [Paraburkholderia humisilvae]|uniref:Malonate decarboxylase acyl carrier protein n=1 Tax=Paraburkholderia humisilvae TaxID=627669 RepID=A0A6J5F439_9BURK|nr:malonate decarboxylase acyl carrier protein [Paraburkholderia humisilvae]CAB3773184.1 Malonate decarboxylase acyl carrier protein [Paraburkholderia humisilvae]
MESLRRVHATLHRLPGEKARVILGVVASGNLEVLAERVLEDGVCEVHVSTAVAGYGEIWTAVVADFIEQYSPGGVRFSINDAGARPDAVLLRLAQVCHALME